MVSMQLQALLDAPDLGAAVEQAFPYDCGVHPEWINKMRCLVLHCATLIKVHKNATGDRLAAVLFRMPNKALLKVLASSQLGVELAKWDMLMVTTLRDCTLAVLECRWDSEAPSPRAAVIQVGRIAA